MPCWEGKSKAGRRFEAFVPAGLSWGCARPERDPSRSIRFGRPGLALKVLPRDDLLLDGRKLSLWCLLQFKELLVVLHHPILFQAIFLGLLMKGQEDHTVAQQWAMHTKDVLLQVDRIFVLLLESQGSLRSFALSDDPRFAQEATQVVTQIQPALDRLHALVGDSQRQQQRLIQLEGEVKTRLAWHQEILGGLKGSGRAAAVARLRTPEGDDLMQAVQDEISAFRATETQLDQTRLETLRQSTLRQRWTLLGGILLNVLVGAVAVMLFGRNVNRRGGRPHGKCAPRRQRRGVAPAAPGSR